MVKTSYKVDPQQLFARSLADAQARVRDLSEPLSKIADDFYRSNRATFSKRGAGGYPDLTAAYKVSKRKQVGFVYPILVRSGALQRSATSRTDRNSFLEISDGNTISFGSKLPYAQFVQEKRPFMFFGQEYPQIATAEQLGRIKRWSGILADYVLAVSPGGEKVA